MSGASSGGPAPSAAAAPSAAPPAASVFAPAADRHGVRLALVFGNHALGGQCPWYRAAACHHCDIGAGEGAAFDAGSNRERLAWFRRHYGDALLGVEHVVLYDSGSVLSPRELPPDVLREILAFVRSLPRARVVSLDTREAFVTAPNLRRVAEALGPGRTARPILGLESADDRIRDELLQKRMPRAAVLRAIAALGEAARAQAAGGAAFGLDVNVVVAAPGTTARTAVADAVATARFALDAGAAQGLPVDLCLHPYYPSERGRARFPAHPRCDVATAAQAARAIAPLAGAHPLPAHVYVGWNDEGHDTERRDAATAAIVAAAGAFDAFNRTGDPRALDALAGDEGGR